jgi:hypothetical protein
MAIQLSVPLRNAMVSQYETTIGASPKLQLRTGAPPADCAAADAGTLLDEIALPADWMSAADSGQVTLAGSWVGTGAAAAGTVGHYRLKDGAGTNTHEQGTVTITGGGGDLTLDNPTLAVAQIVTVTSWVRSQGGA